MSEVAVRVSGVSKRYPMRPQRGRFHSLKGALLRGELWAREQAKDGFLALSGVDLEIARGETVAVIGPNASGKSTLLKLVAGILHPTSGTVEVAGRVTALIELGAGFHPEISGRENVVINGMMHGLSRAEVQRRLPWIVDFADVGPFIDQPIKTFSSGMYVRLGFAVAVAAEPDVLVVDEVLAVGDQAFTHKCLDRIAALQRRGTAILLVSHDLALVEQLAHRTLYLREGRPVMSGHTPAVVSRYRSDVASQEAGEAASEVRVGGKRWGNNAVVLTSVELLDGQGRAVGSVRTGEAAALRLAYHVREPQEDFVFGIAIHREDGSHVFGTNTDLDGFRPQRLDQDGEVRIEFPSLQLAPGRYVVDAAVHAVGGLAYDYACEVCTFLVTAPVGWPGCYAPAHRWRFSGPAFEAPPSEP